MKLEGIVACVDFADYLQFTLPPNKACFDYLLVVTVERDKSTQLVCKENGVDFICTDEFYHNGAKFDRGRAVSHCLKYLKHFDWLCSFDSDILMPNMKMWMESQEKEFNKEFLYGARRIFIPTYEDWLSFCRGELDLSTMDTPEGFGFGYFMLFNMQSDVIKREPLENLYVSGNSCRETDWMTRNKWSDFEPNSWNPGPKLKELPFYVLHLGKDQENNSNHFGRVSASFF